MQERGRTPENEPDPENGPEREHEAERRDGEEIAAAEAAEPAGAAVEPVEDVADLADEASEDVTASEDAEPAAAESAAEPVAESAVGEPDAEEPAAARPDPGAPPVRGTRPLAGEPAEPPVGRPRPERPEPASAQPPRGPRPQQPPRRDPQRDPMRPVPVRRGPDGEPLPPRPPRPAGPRPAGQRPAGTRPAATHHAAPPAADPVSQGRNRLLHAFWPPRFSRNQLVVGVLLACLGAALAIQVRATNSSDQLLRAARPDDLVHILDEVTARGQRLDSELRDLTSQKAALQNSTDKAQAALQQAQEKAKDLQILAGTTKATGPGITVTITDPLGKVNAAALLNTLQELRAAGAEVVQLGDVRIVVSSAFLDTANGRVSVDGHVLTAPYVFKVIGDPATLKPALGIPGGVVESLRSNAGATTDITSGQILVDAVAPVPNPQYAKAG